MTLEADEKEDIVRCNQIVCELSEPAISEEDENLSESKDSILPNNALALDSHDRKRRSITD